MASTPLRFTKMHSLGNDFIVIDATQEAVPLPPQAIKRLSCRKTGIGFDQCLMLEPAKTQDADFFYRIYNADGSEVGQCLNGARCMGHFIAHTELWPADKAAGDPIVLETNTTQITLSVEANNTVTTFLPPPQLAPAAIPLKSTAQADAYDVTVTNQSFKIHALSVGNPHAILFVDSLTDIDFETLGQHISTHDMFPEGANVSFVECLSADSITLRVYERGCGETQACGSAAAASVAAGRLFHDLSSQVTVHFPGGQLTVHWPSPDAQLRITGPSTLVYEGVVGL